MEETRTDSPIESAPDNVAPVSRSKEDSHFSAREPVLFQTSTDIVERAYYQGYHDAFKDVMAVAILYALALYLLLRYTVKG